MSAQKSTVASSKRSAFLWRGVTTFCLWGLIAAALAFNSAPLVIAFISVVMLLACIEFFALLDRPGPGWGGVRSGTTIVVVGHLLALAYSFHFGGGSAVGAIELVTLALLPISVTCVLLINPIEPARTRDMLFGSFFAFVYIGLLGSFLIRLLYTANDPLSLLQFNGGFYLLFLLVVAKFSDMGAYLVGSLIGRRKFIPHISPGKTWEGILLGAFPFAIGGAALVFALFQDHLGLLAWKDVLILGVILAIAAIIGDLAESVLKRCLEKKDSGKTLPGIGGVLDLVDSVLFAAPVMYFYLLALV